MFKANYTESVDPHQRELCVSLSQLTCKAKYLCSRILSYPIHDSSFTINEDLEQLLSNDGNNTCLNRKLRILLVEDNKLIALVHKNMLSQLNCEWISLQMGYKL